MELINFDFKKYELGALAVALGEFDGLHLAHQILISETVNYAREQGIKSAVISFDPHPDFVLKKRNYQGYITPLSVKIKNMEALNIDYFIIVPFTESLSRFSPEEFETRVLDSFQIRKVFVGFDYRYGYRGEGNAERLQQKYPVYVLDKIEYHQEKMGSEGIRSLLLAGEVSEVAKILRRNYTVSGKVVPGDAIGRQIGYRTANIDLKEDFQLMRDGVYAVNVLLNNKQYLGLANYGHNPTLNYTERPRLEVHILDFNGDIYGQEISLEFLEFLRPERKYQRRDELKEQIENDIARVRKGMRT
jgi:riboflavin kinase/FMN adenylyltransferase